MPADHHLQTQINQLREEIADLKKALARPRPARTPWRLLAAAVLGALLAAPLWPALVAGDKEKKEGKDLPELTCARLTIQSKTGKPLLVLEGDADGGLIGVNSVAGKRMMSLEVDKDGGFIRINGLDGKRRVFIGVGVRAGGLMVLGDNNEKARSIWEVTEQGVPGLIMNGKTGKEEAYFGVSAKGYGGLVNLNNADGVSQIILDVNKDRIPVFGMYGQDRKKLIVMGGSTLGSGGVLNVNGPTGSTRVVLDADDRGDGRVSVMNRRDELVLDVGADAKGGAIALKAPKGDDPLRLGIGPGALGGFIELRDADGQRQSLSAPSVDALFRRAKRFD